MKSKKFRHYLKESFDKLHLSDNIKICIIISISMIILMSMALSGLIKFNIKNNKIIVSGSAQKHIVSDLIVWTGNFSTKSFNLKEAFNKLQKDLVKIRSFLKSKGINEDEIIINSIIIEKDFKKVKINNEESQIFDGFLLSQSIRIESKNVDKIEKVSREITDLIQQGVEFYSSQPEYYYTTLSELKKIMVGLAANDAYNRAKQIAENSHCNLGNLKNAKMGIFQIIGQNSAENFTFGGTFNTSSKNKTVSINVTLEYNVK